MDELTKEATRRLIEKHQNEFVIILGECENELEKYGGFIV